MKYVDMSSEAITKRLRLASDLRDLCVSLRRAKIAHDEGQKNKPEETQPSMQELDPRENEPA